MKKAFYKPAKTLTAIFPSGYRLAGDEHDVYMFFGAKNFDHFIGSGMFQRYGWRLTCRVMPKAITKTWISGTPKVCQCKKMFFNAKSFDKPIHLTWQGTAASTKQLHLLKDAATFNEKYSCEDGTDGPLTSCSEIGAAGEKTGSSKKVSKEEETSVSHADKKVETKEYDIRCLASP